MLLLPLSWAIRVDNARLWLRAFVAQLCAMVRRRLFTTRMSPPRPGDCTVSPQWLSKVLGVAVTKVELLALDGNLGLAAEMVRVVPTCADGKVRPLMLKRSSDTRASRLVNIAAGRYREASFYHRIASIGGIGNAFRLPTVHYAMHSSFFGEYVLLLEDVSVDSAVAVKRVFGNQCWGMPDSDPARHVNPIETLERLAVATADMHAQHWRDPKLFSVTWLRQVEYFQGRERVKWERGVQRGREFWAVAKRIRTCMSPKLTQLVDASLEASTWQAFQEHIHKPETPWTLCHGDFHGGNLLMTAESLYLFDWSEINVGEPYALGQLLVSDVPPALFIEHSERLMRLYWTTLCDRGVTGWSWPACWDSYCRRTVERWLYLFAYMAGVPALPDVFIRYFDAQLIAFIESHGDFDCYPVKNVVEFP